jgi:hypothetical protein
VHLRRVLLLDPAAASGSPMEFLDGGVGHGGSWSCKSSCSGRCLVGGATRRSSTVEVAASPPTVRLGSEQAFQLHQAPDLGAVGTEVGLNVRGHLANGGHVDTEQLRAPFQRRCDRPAQVQVVPSPHRGSLSNACSRSNRESCLRRPVSHVATSGPCVTGSQRTTRAAAGPQSALLTERSPTAPGTRGRPKPRSGNA